jgi:hypothetical protein
MLSPHIRLPISTRDPCDATRYAHVPVGASLSMLAVVYHAGVDKV